MNISKLFKAASAFYKLAGINHAEAYSVLKLPYGTPIEFVKKQFRNLSKTHHPDKGGEQDIYSKITEAYTFLLNHPVAPQRREQYSEPKPPTTSPRNPSPVRDFNVPGPQTHLIFDSKIFGTNGERFNTRGEAMYELPIDVGNLEWFYTKRNKSPDNTSNISIYKSEYSLQIVTLKYDGKYTASCAYMKLDNIKNVIKEYGKEQTIKLVAKNINSLISQTKRMVGLTIPFEEYINAVFFEAVTRIVLNYI